MTSDQTKNMLSMLVYSTLVTKLNDRPLDELADVSCRIAEDIGTRFAIVSLEDCARKNLENKAGLAVRVRI